MLLVWLATAGGTEYLAWFLGNDAARRIDPTWEPRGEMNYPNLAYKMGFVEELREEDPESMMAELMAIFI